jgi:hypothetical protein
MGDGPQHTLIHVPRTLIRDCAALFHEHDQWKARPLRSVIKLIYCLNTLWDRYPLIRYHRGFPQPAKCVRELEGLAGLCRRAARTRNVGPVLNRLSALQRNTSDSVNLITYQVARELRPDRPEAIVRDAVTDERLMAIAASAPEHLAGICDDCAAAVATFKTTGRGGYRHEAELAARFVIEALGHYFESLTKRRPTVLFKDDLKIRSRDRYYGQFFLFCRAVFAALGKTVSSRQVFDLLNSIDIPHWKAPESLRQAWDPQKRKKESPH